MSLVLLKIFINDLADGIANLLANFKNKTKLWVAVSHLEDKSVI